MAVDSSVIAALASSGLALAATVFTGLRTNKVERRSYALQELESSLKYRAEDINSMLSRLKAMEDKVLELETNLEKADADKRAIHATNTSYQLRITALETELLTVKAERDRLRTERDTLLGDVHQLETIAAGLRARLKSCEET